MKKIKSFTINHQVLKKGMYISRIDGDAVTYDLRMVTPNTGLFMDYGAIHTIEHLFATYVRSGEYSEDVIYFGPMGCRTGFYFIVRDRISHQEALDLVRETLEFIKSFYGKIPGADPFECGNFREHNLLGAINQCVDYAEALKDWTVEKMAYPK
ncbi:MAG: S-ribosylhomocysteine lyase [Bacillota bacterium]